MDEPLARCSGFTEPVADTDLSYQELPARVRRRLAVTSLLRSLLVSLVIVAGYFLLPMSNVGDSLAVLGCGLAAVALLLGWQLREITRTPHPRIKAIGAMATSVPLFLVVFATSYYLMGRAQPEHFSEPLTRLDAAYFSLTIFATVGFGDITAVSQAARAVAMVQMLAGLVIVGVVARVLFGAIQVNLSHRES